MSIKHMYYRLYQGVFRIAVNFLDWTPPKIISGPGSVKKLPQVIKEKGLSKMMIVTDKGLTGLNLLDGLYEGLKANAFAKDVQPAKTAGMNEHAAKPLDMKRLCEILHRRL